MLLLLMLLMLMMLKCKNSKLKNWPAFCPFREGKKLPKDVTVNEYILIYIYIFFFYIYIYIYITQLTRLARLPQHTPQTAHRCHLLWGYILIYIYIHIYIYNPIDSTCPTAPTHPTDGSPVPSAVGLYTYIYIYKFIYIYIYIKKNIYI